MLAPFDRLGRHVLLDSRDGIYLAVMAGCTAVALAGIGIYFTAELPILHRLLISVVYLIAWGLLVLDRFILFLHAASHRGAFQGPVKRFFDVYIAVLGLFFGQTPGTYQAHHLGMHHPEENALIDESTTLPYQRDRIDHWLRYFFRFLFLCMLTLPRYLVRTNRAKLAKKCLSGEFVALALYAGLAYVDPLATFTVFLFPLFLVRALMMAGNWGQHAFANPERPTELFDSTTCLAPRYNRRGFNDGFHVEHHRHPRMHWSEMPAAYEKDLATYGAHDAIVFKDADFFMVWFFLMTRQWKRLARGFVQLPGAPVRSQEEVIAYLKQRARARVASRQTVAVPSASISMGASG